jgi:hypothetical protein
LPTFRAEPRFDQDFARLTPEQVRAFYRAIARWVEDLKAGRQPRSGLRIHGVETHSGVWRFTWADDGRATFSYGVEVRRGEEHIVWRRVGGHEIYGNP